MLKSLALFLLLVVFNFSFFAQNSNPLRPPVFEQKLIHHLFLKYLNGMRDSLKLGKLTPNSILDSAALDQSKFITSKRALSHEQPLNPRKTVSDRVNLYHGSFNGVGENVAMLPIQLPFTIKGKQMVILTYEDLAYALFLTWKNSPGHYKNMITPTFKFSGLWVEYEPKTKSIYSANVFGGDQYIAAKLFEKRYRPTTFSMDEEGKYNALKNTTFSVSVANYLDPTADSIALYHSYLPEILPFFSGKDDGLMIDFVVRDQFTCKGENKLDFSPIYDGYLTPPTYSKQLLNTNTLKSKNELHSNLTAIPSEIKKSFYQANSVMFKDKKVYSYTWPLGVFRDDYKVLQFKPFLDFETKIPVDTVLTYHFSDKIFFHKGTANPVQDAYFQESLMNVAYLPADGKLKRVHITGYSSVEGDSLQNVSLQQKRGAFLKHYLLRNANLNEKNVTIGSKANKHDFVRDFGGKCHLKENASLAAFNQLYQTSKNEFPDSILANHRYTTFDYDLELRLNVKTSDRAMEFMYQHISEMPVNTKSAFLKVLLHKIQTEEHLNLSYIDPTDFASITNKSLLLPFYFYASDSANLRKLYRQNRVINNWNEKDFYNFAIANFRYYETYGKPFIGFGELEGIIKGISDKIITEDQRNLLYLNLYLIETHFYKEVKNFDACKKAIYNFKRVFLLFDVSLEDLIGIGLFFNNYNLFQETLEILKPKLDQYPKHEELWFTYLSTYTFAMQSQFDENMVDRLILQCKGLNKDRFCSWINDENFQLLRIPMYKKRYCGICEK